MATLPLSGPILGLLAFPPVFSRSNVVVSPLMLAIFLVAAVSAGTAAGLVSARLVVVPVRANRSIERRVEKKRGNASGPREKYRGISIPWPGLTAKALHYSPPAKSTQLVSSGAVSALICFAFWTTLGTLLRSPES